MLWIKLLTWLKGEFVGQDSFGNKYYRERGPKSINERRWVIYRGLAEPSKVPAEWHGWLHHTMQNPPSIEPVKKWPWEKNHLPNLTGTPYAYRPSGHYFSSGENRPATKGYVAWKPQEEKNENEST